GLRAGVAVCPGVAVGLRRVRAHTGAGVAGPRVVALVGRRADDEVAPRADPALAGVGLGARVAVVAGRAVGLARVRAHARAGVADAHVVALVRGRADDRVGAHAGAALAGIGLGAGVGVVAWDAVILRRVGAV